MLGSTLEHPGVHVFVTHDILVTATAARALDVPLGRSEWPRFLEGALFWQDGAATCVEYRHHRSRAEEPPPMIAGLYPYTRGGITRPPSTILAEIPASLAINPSYERDLVVLAGDRRSAQQLEGFGLRVHRVFDDAPPDVVRDAVHKMKHWMCLWALRECGEFLWVDWDTVMLRPPDEGFWSYCRSPPTPKFIRIDNYWATVNCGVYYACDEWLPAMERSFGAEVSEPNDELLWTSVLPADVRERPEYWWGERVQNVWSERGFARVTAATYCAHVQYLQWAESLRVHVRQLR